VPNHSDDARHDKGQHVPSKPRRLIAGLALPTAAAVALVCAAAAGAVTSSSKGPSNLLLTTTAATASAQPAVVESAAQRSTRLVEVARAEAVTAANARLVASAQAAAAKKAHAEAQAAKAAAADRAQAKVAARAQAAVRAQAFARTRVVARSITRKKIAARHASAGAHSWRLPITHPIKTSGFGYRWGRLHAGEDFAVSVGTPLKAMSSGKVSFAGVQSGFGNIVQIRYWDGTISYFGHMSSISVHVGQRVSIGQFVGRSGNTGHSTGPHLHLEIHPHGGAAVDPLPWLARHHIAP
jgi:murein DD-endopeptidase MepM/ murein hydrolase activator NlpD